MNRVPEFSRPESLEALLSELEIVCAPGEAILAERFSDGRQKWPLVFIVGPSRSGSTLLSQWLANLGIFAYPSNLLSRFYYAPLIGARIQQLLFDPKYSFRNELAGLTRNIEYSSSNGKTSGILSPHSFGYFWRRFFPKDDRDRDVWSNDELQRVFDIETCRKELVDLTAVFDQPFFVKAMLFNYNLEFLNRSFEKVLFLRTRRGLDSQVQSVLDARVRQSGDRSIWYSYKITEYESIKDMEPELQVREQTLAINRTLDQSLKSIPTERVMEISYENFCSNPADVYIELIGKLGMTETAPRYSGPSQFKISR